MKIAVWLLTAALLQFTLGYRYEGVVKIAQGRHCMYISTEGSLDIAESDNDLPYGPEPLRGLTLYDMYICFVITVISIQGAHKVPGYRHNFQEIEFSVLYLHQIDYNIFFRF